MKKSNKLTFFSISFSFTFRFFVWFWIIFRKRYCVLTDILKEFLFCLNQQSCFFLQLKPILILYQFFFYFNWISILSPLSWNELQFVSNNSDYLIIIEAYNLIRHQLWYQNLALQFSWALPHTFLNISL